MMSTPRKTPRKQPMSPRRRSLRGTPSTAMVKSPMKTPSKTTDEGKEEGIIVAVRMRPLNQNEGSHQRVWKVLPKYHSVSQTTRTGQPLPERVSGRTFFTFDKTFNETVSTTEVYDSVAKDIVSSVVSGLNGTIFAYGQTSSGKTYTMQGSGSIKEGSMGGGGIVHMAANDIFNNISKAQDRIFLVRASFLEIYNEEVRDLLSSNSPTLQIREDPRRGVFVQSREETVTDFDGLLGILFQGENNRAFASTAMNERSSRSHTIFRVTIESRKKGAATNDEDTDDESVKENVVPTDDGAVLISTLNLVDLAGSESVRHTGATGERQKEGGMINTSLLTLSRVIVALGAPNQTHINFRDSKLTRILQPSLSGNARMAVICCATPSELYLEETRSTLLFASRAKLVKTRAQVNEVLDDRSIIRRLQRELAEARKQVPGSMQNKHLKELELKADEAGNAAREAENKLVRLKKSILNYGLAQPTKAVDLLAKSFDGGSNSQKGKEAKGKRRYSEGALQIGRKNVTTPTRALKAASPQTSHKISKLEPTAASELQLLRDALAAKNNLIKDLSGELAKSKAEVATSNRDLDEAHIQIQQLGSLHKETLSNKETELDQRRVELERSTATCTALSESYEELVSEKESMQQKLEADKQNLDGALQALRSEHQMLESQHLQSLRDLEELGRVHDDAKTKLAVIEEENMKILTTVAENEAEKTSLLSELEQSRREAAVALDRISQLESQLCECKSANDALSYQSREQAYEYQELAKEKQKLEGSLNQELASSRESNESLLRNNSELKATLDTTEDKVRDLSQQVEQMSSQVSDLESLLVKQSSEHDVSLKTADSIKEELVSAREVISTLKLSLEEKRSDLTVLAQSLEDVMVQAAQGQSETFAMQSSNDKAARQTEHLLVVAAEIKSQQAVCNKENSEALAAIHALEQQIETIDSFVQRSELHLTTVVEALETEKGQLQENLATSNDEKAVLSSSLKQSEATLSSLRAQAHVYEEETKCQLATLEEKVNQVTSEKECLVSELSTLKDECESQKATQQDSEARLAELTSECESARIANEIISSSLQEAESRIVTLEQDVQKESLRREEVSSDLASATVQLEAACASLKESELASAAFLAKHESLKSQLGDLLATKALLEEERNNSLSEIGKLDGKLSDLELSVENSERCLEEAMETATVLQQEKEQLEAEATASHDDLVSKLRTVESQVTVLQEKLDQETSLKDQIATQLQDALADKGILESELESTITELEAMGSRNSELEEATRVVNDKLVLANDEKTSIESELEETRNSKQELEHSLAEKSSQVVTLEQELALAQQIHAELGTKVSAADQELSAVRQSREETLLAVSSLEEKLQSYDRTIDDLTKAKELLESEARNSTTEMEALVSRIGELQDALDKNCGVLESQTKTTEAIQNEKESLEAKLQALNLTYAEISTHRDTVASELEVEKERAGRLENELAQTKKAYEHEMSLQESLREENARLGYVISECNSRIEDMSGKIAELTTSVEEGKGNLATLTNDLEIVQTERANAMQTLEQMTAEKTDLQNENTLATKKMEVLATTIAKLTTDIEDGELKTNEIKRELESTQSHMATLQRDLQISELRNIESVEESAKQAEINIQGLHEELAKQKATNNELLIQLETETKELKTLQQKHARLEAVVDEVSCSKVALEAANGSATAELELLGSRNRELQLELETSEKSLAHKVEAFATLKDEKEGLEAELRASQMELDKALSSRDALEKKSHEVELRLMHLQEEMKSNSDDEEKLQEMRNEVVALQRERDEVAAKYQALDQQHQTTLHEFKTVLSNSAQEKIEAAEAMADLEKSLEIETSKATALNKQIELLAEEKQELESRLTQSSNDLSNAVASRDEFKFSMKKAETQILSLNAKIEELEAAKDDHENGLLQQAREAAIAADDELADKERELQSALRKITQLEEEIQVLLEDSHSPRNGSLSNVPSNDLLDKYEKLEADYAHSIEQLENERADREASEKALKQMMGEEQRVLVQEGETRMSQLRAELEGLRKRVTDAEAEAYAAREAHEQCQDQLKLSKTESDDLRKEVSSLQEFIREGKKTVAELEAKVTEAEASKQSVVREGKKKLAELQRKLTESEAASSAATTAQSQYQEHTDRLQKEISQLENENERLRVEGLEMQKKLEEQEDLSNKEISRLTNSINTNKAELHASRQTILDLQYRLDSAEGEATQALEEKLQESEKLLAEKDEQIKKLGKGYLNKEQRKRLATMKDEHTKYKKENKVLEKKLKDAETENRSLQVAVANQSEESVAVEIQSLHKGYQKKIASLEASLAKLSNGPPGSNDDDDNSQVKLREEINRIHADYTQRLKVAAKHISTLQKAQEEGTIQSTETPAYSASEIQSLKTDNDALNQKLKKYARHCQLLEDDKGAIMDALSSTLGSAPDNDLVDAVSKLCDQHISIQEQCEKLREQLQGQHALEYDVDRVQSNLSKVLDRKVSSQTEIAAAVESLCDQNATLKEQNEKLQSLQNASFRVKELEKELDQLSQVLEDVREKAHKMKIGSEETIRRLEEENWQLINTVKDLKQKLKIQRSQANQLRQGFSGTMSHANTLQTNEPISNLPPSSNKKSSMAFSSEKPPTAPSFDSSENSAMEVPASVTQSSGSPSSSKALSFADSRDSSDSPSRKRTMHATESKTPNGKRPRKSIIQRGMDSAKKIMPGSSRKKKKDPEAPQPVVPRLGEPGVDDADGQPPECKQS